MRPNLQWNVFLILVLTLVACTRKAADHSSVHISLPGTPAQLKASSVQALSDPTFCFYVNITGSGLTQTSSACAPAEGTSSGFVEPFAAVEILVPKGSGRTVELYGYIPRASETCATLGSALASVPVNRLFRLAQKPGIDMSADQVTVDLTEKFPGITQHYGLQGPLPPACYASLPPVIGAGSGTSVAAFQLSVGSQMAVQQGMTAATGVKLVGRFGSTIAHAPLVSVDGVRLQVR